MSVLDGPVSKKVKGTAEIDEGKLLTNAHTCERIHTTISTQMESGAALIFWGIGFFWSYALHDNSVP